jgi:hypothetical protein
MLIEVKVKVARVIDGKTRKRTETYIVPDCELFVSAEHMVMLKLAEEQDVGLVGDFAIQVLRVSPIKEICTQWLEDYTQRGFPVFLATLKDTWLTDDGTEKSIKYKVLLWAMDHSQALQRVNELARQGYDMQIEGIKQVDYEYLAGQSNQEEETENG